MATTTNMMSKAYVASIKTVKNGVYQTVITSSAPDRDGEVVSPGAIQDAIAAFMKHPILVSSHTYHGLQSQIGRVNKIHVDGDGKTVAEIEYYFGKGNAEADWGHQLAEMGQAAFSIGFVPLEWKDSDTPGDPKRTYTKLELLELSQVLVPSNRDALMSARSKGVLPAEVDALFSKALSDLEAKSMADKSPRSYRLSPKQCEAVKEAIGVHEMGYKMHKDHVAWHAIGLAASGEMMERHTKAIARLGALMDEPDVDEDGDENPENGPGADVGKSIEDVLKEFEFGAIRPKE